MTKLPCRENDVNACLLLCCGLWFWDWSESSNQAPQTICEQAAMRIAFGQSGAKITAAQCQHLSSEVNLGGQRRLQAIGVKMACPAPMVSPVGTNVSPQRWPRLTGLVRMQA